MTVAVSVIVRHRSSGGSRRWDVIVHTLEVVRSWYSYWGKAVLGGERGGSAARTGWVQRLRFGNWGVVVIIVELVV